jgi:hypothetical protein
MATIASDTRLPVVLLGEHRHPRWRAPLPTWPDIPCAPGEAYDDDLSETHVPEPASRAPSEPPTPARKAGRG